LSRIFKSNYVKIGTPKHIKSNTPAVIKIEEPIPVVEPQVEDLEEKANSIIDDAKNMYLRIIDEANTEAQKILEEAQRERENIYSISAEQGYNEGHNAGYTEGTNQASNIIQQAAELKLMLDERRNQMYKEAEAELMEMVLDISKKIIGDELTQNPDVILSLIRQAIAKCAFKEKLVIRVSEQDYDYVKDNRDRIIMLAEGINDLEIYCDKALAKGSCIVETSSGEINSGVNVQFNEIQKAFEYLIRNE
jgi:flagellar assembly protein FliH